MCSPTAALPVWEAQDVLLLGWCNELMPSVKLQYKSRSFSTAIKEAASDLHQDSSDQHLLFNIHLATSFLRAAEFQATAVECEWYF